MMSKIANNVIIVIIPGVRALSLFALIFCSFQSICFGENYANFAYQVEKSFQGQQNNNTKQQIGKFDDGSTFDFSKTLEANYLNFAESRYQQNDFIDAYYFKTKAMKIKNYKIIAPANPYSFGILPDDIEQFIIAREQLRNASINSIINSNDGLVLADSYIAFDCWLEAFEEGNTTEKMNRCKNRFLDNMKALRMSLLIQGYNLFDMTTKENLALNNRNSSCESCALYNKGLYCNALYFDKDEIKLMDKMNVVIKRLQKKMTYFNSPTITIMYYQNAYGYTKKLGQQRVEAVKNIVYNNLSKDLPIKPLLKITPITLPKKLTGADKKIYRDVISVCVSGNE